jgi:hypothetical protein
VTDFNQKNAFIVSSALSSVSGAHAAIRKKHAAILEN